MNWIRKVCETIFPPGQEEKERRHEAREILSALQSLIFSSIKWSPANDRLQTARHRIKAMFHEPLPSEGDDYDFHAIEQKVRRELLLQGWSDREYAALWREMNEMLILYSGNNFLPLSKYSPNLPHSFTPSLTPSPQSSCDAFRVALRTFLCLPFNQNIRRAAIRLPEYSRLVESLYDHCYSYRAFAEKEVPLRVITTIAINFSNCCPWNAKVLSRQGEHRHACVIRKNFASEYDYGDMWASIASTCADQGWHDEAILAYEKAIDPRCKRFHTVVHTDIQNLAWSYYSVGRMVDSVNCARNAVNHVLTHGKSKSVEYLQASTTLATLHYNCGEFVHSEQTLQAALVIANELRKPFGKQSACLSNCVPEEVNTAYLELLSVLASVYRETGADTRADQIFSELLPLVQRFADFKQDMQPFLDEPGKYAVLAACCAHSLMRQCDRKSAKQLLTNILVRLPAALRNNSLYFAPMILVLAEIRVEDDELDQATKDLLTLEQCFTANGRQDRTLRSVYWQLYDVSARSKRFVEAKLFLQKATVVSNAAETKFLSDVSFAIVQALIAIANNDADEAMRVVFQLSFAKDELLANLESVASEQRLISLKLTLNEVFQLSFYINSKFRSKDDIGVAVIGDVWRHKGTVNSIIVSRQQRTRSYSEELQETALRNTEPQSASSPRTKARGITDALLHSAANYEFSDKNLDLDAEIWSTFWSLEGKQYLAASPQKFKQAIAETKDDFVAVEFVRSEKIMGVGKSEYFALLFRPQRDVWAQYIRLGDAARIDQEISSFRVAVESRVGARHLYVGDKVATGSDFMHCLSRISSLVWGSIEQHCDQCSRVFIAPDGQLWQLPFEILVDSTGRHLIDCHEISYCANCFELKRYFQVQRSPINCGPPAIFGDPDYDCIVDRLSDSGGANLQSSFRQRGWCFSPLPGTRVEAENVASLLDVKPILGKEASIERLLTLARPSILHLATHGFIIPSVSRTERQLLDPMLQSGIALSGANVDLRQQATFGDSYGILSARRASSLDLADTQLVVLSACETGMGSVCDGEGVLGLRRAFISAGAATVIASMWPVDDTVTMELMAEFYQGILSGQRCSQALRNAQFKVKAQLAAPWLWGAFVCHGSSRSVRL